MARRKAGKKRPSVSRAVVIGASAGGVETLKEVVSRLPTDFAAAVFVVLHIPPFTASFLPEILTGCGRLPAGHPEGYIEGFAQIYTDTASLIRSVDDGLEPDPVTALLPTAPDGLRGMRFIATALESNRRGGVWVSISK